MMHLPDYHLSVVVMVNAFPNQGAEYIAKGLIRVVLKDIGAIGIIPYIPLFPTGIRWIGIIMIIISITIFTLKKLRSKSR
jgi:hypothetical protein